MKIGIGITTTSNRKEHLELCLRQIEKHTKDYQLFVANDVPTIAKAKNECLYALKDCDHIFLFDDDCFPVKDGWVDFFFSQDISHCLYLTERHNPINKIKGFYNDCGGCFMYIRKDAFDEVGYFNTEYKQYGFEHAGWSSREKRAFKYLSYYSPQGTGYFIYSLDYQGEGNWGVKHKPSITDYKAMQESIDYNRKVFEKEINSDKIYYEYKP